MKPTTRRTWRGVAAGLAAVVAIGGLALTQPATAVTPTETARLATFGDFPADRYATAAAVAVDTFPDGASNVILATGEDFADALAASGMAGALDAPVVLTTSDELLDVTAEVLQDLGAETVYLMGGTAALAQGVEDALTSDGYETQRVQGDDRFGTAAAAAQVIADQADGLTGDGGIGETSGGVTAFVTNGFRFPDAVSASPVAYAGNLPVLLTEKDSVPASTMTAIDDLGIEHVVFVGGTAVISSAVREQIESEGGVSTSRLAGTDRFLTNVDVVQFGVDETGLGGETVYLSTGRKFPDALVGGPAAGQNLNRLLLVEPDGIPAPIEAYIEDNGSGIDRLVALGGTAAISDEALTTAADLAQLDNNQAFEVSPATPSSTPSSSSAVNNDGRRDFTASGLDASTTYVVALLDSTVVGADEDGNVTLSEYRTAQGPDTAIETVNGDSVTSGGPAGSGTETVQIEASSNASGNLTFGIDSTDFDSVIPFVYRDVNGNDALDLVDGLPDEPFGMGGLTEWFGQEAASGDYTGNPSIPGDEPNMVRIEFVSRTGNFFTTSQGTFFYSATDALSAKKDSGTEVDVTLEQFEGMLTANDQMSIEYRRDEKSLFLVNQDVMADMGEITAAAVEVSGDNDDVLEISWEPTDQPDTVYDVYEDKDRNGSLAEADGSPVVSETSETSVEITYTAGPSSTRFIVVPKGGFTKVEDDPGPYDGSDPFAAANFVSDLVAVGLGVNGAPRLLSNGAAVSFNSGISAAGANDEWMLHFSHPVTVAGNASITVGGKTFDNGTSESTWTVIGNSVLITLGSAADQMSFSYGGGTGADITALSGVRGTGGNAVTSLGDTKLEHNGPELMRDSATCRAGGVASCTIAFNEPVDETTAETRSNWRFVPDGASSLRSITLLEDGRTVALTIDGTLTATDEIAPNSAPGDVGVEDDDGQVSGQVLFEFVYAN